jgi:hypothetical protein
MEPVDPLPGTDLRFNNFFHTFDIGVKLRNGMSGGA